VLLLLLVLLLGLLLLGLLLLLARADALLPRLQLLADFVVDRALLPARSVLQRHRKGTLVCRGVQR
jgi:hypothetical protein